ncbi:hypothetical protein HanXRQr2_Chr11g0483041 [Helianthus annuus]|uniref:Uncharacterized protein n=1 Tax=Helianthus annuus TaxID=4232 RepID=A0A251T9P2_HELAN|nr:hypothetical protein HanXRQr2_Chr11g0483041 [Helianthus annuus]KAJ0516899.1 hypothetical protein HanHA89_Chr11g0419071 [Helianthus annuus]KAJ0874537.1 hypothetical protein HanPSC8_Chr11g0465331 [Helianthus annuus]
MTSPMASIRRMRSYLTMIFSRLIVSSQPSNFDSGNINGARVWSSAEFEPNFGTRVTYYSFQSVLSLCFQIYIDVLFLRVSIPSLWYPLINGSSVSYVYGRYVYKIEWRAFFISSTNTQETTTEETRTTFEYCSPNYCSRRTNGFKKFGPIKPNGIQILNNRGF